ncbi:MAG: hypothetical protein WC557_04850 [Ignavibacteriaceae bacterium]
MTFGFSLSNMETGNKTVIATALSLIAAISFNSSTVFSKRALRDVGFKMGTYLKFLFSTIIMLVIASFTGDIKSIVNVTSTHGGFFFCVITLNLKLPPLIKYIW